MSSEMKVVVLRVEQILMNMQAMYSSGNNNIQLNLESFQKAIEA
jgi:hypothetical protein